MSESLLGFGWASESHEGYTALILCLGEFRPQFERTFIKNEGTAEVALGMSVLAALKQLNRIGLTVRGIVCLTGCDLEAESHENEC